MGDKYAVMSNAGSALSEGMEPLKIWEARLENEPPKAFKAFCLFCEMGYKRSIKLCMEINGIEPNMYGSWSRYARLYNWKNRALAYDEYIAHETERQILAERIERKKRQIEMLNGFDDLVRKRLKTLNPEELNAPGAMDLLERSAKLDAFITGADKETKAPVQGELALTFVDSFKGL